MTTKSKPKSQNKNSSGNLITIVVAIIGVAGACIAAFIGILPEFPGFDALNSSTSPITYIRHDDPLKIYSISLPSEIQLKDRKKIDSELIALYESQPSNLGQDAGFIVTVRAGLENFAFTDIGSEKYNESLIEDYGVQNIIFNQETEKGFLIKLKYERRGYNDNLYLYVLSEFDGVTFVELKIFSVEPDSYVNEIVQKILSGFSWSPSKILEHIGSSN